MAPDQATDLRDDIPLMAIATGNADPFECMLLEDGHLGLVGVREPRREDDGGALTGRIHYYIDARDRLERQPRQRHRAPVGRAEHGRSAAELWGTSSRARASTNYDVVLLPCEGSAYDHGDTARSRLGKYANLGGRVFVTHYSYEWAAPGGNWKSNAGKQPSNEGAPWGERRDLGRGPAVPRRPVAGVVPVPNASGETEPTTITGTINRRSKGHRSSRTGCPATVRARLTDDDEGQISRAAGEARRRLDPVEQRGDAVDRPTAGTRTDSSTYTYTSGGKTYCGPPKSGKLSDWEEIANSASSVQHMTFDTPLDAGLNDAGVPNYCGRVVYSDFHVSASALSGKSTFPASCNTGDLSAQEKALEFMLFDLTSCVEPDNVAPQPTPTCTPPPVPEGLRVRDVPDGCNTGTVANAAPTAPPARVRERRVRRGCSPQSCSTQGPVVRTRRATGAAT